MNKILMLIVIVLVLGAGAYFVMKGRSAYSPYQTTTAVTTPVSLAPSKTATGVVKNFEVSGNEFAFLPKTLNVNKGDTVSVTFTNTGKYPHNFVINELNVQGKTVSAGQNDTVTFIADKVGSFEYYCSVPSHKDRGMVGILTVQ